MDLVSRRQFCGTMMAAAVGSALGSRTEWSFDSSKQYADPFNDVELDVVFKAPSGRTLRIPAFWASGGTWRVRFTAQETGRYSYTTVCSDKANRDLHGRTEAWEATHSASPGAFVKVNADKRHFQTADSKPFFWLGDTWWMGLTSRLSWPEGFQTLTADRVAKGFNIVQIVAGLYPDMPPFDPRGANEAGFPWEADFARINPAYFDSADGRIQHLVDNGIVPCIVGAWGYFLPMMGVSKMKQHWRYLIARWGAYPVIWCLAGEGGMPYYLSKTKETDSATQKHGWTEVARYVRETDAFGHPVTIHPSKSARNNVDDQSLIDFDMLQTGHDDRRSAGSTVETILSSLRAEPKMPVLVGEVCYEGIQEASREEVQRYMFWASILSGAAGHTYGANGIWQVNTRQKPYGLSPHGHSWGDTPWEVAYQLPGSKQLGLAKTLLSRFSWWRLEPRPDLIEPRWTEQDYWQPFAARVPGELIVAFSPTGWKALRFKEVPAGMTAFFWNPTDGTEHVIGAVTPDAEGNWQAPEFPIFRDWVVVLVVK